MNTEKIAKYHYFMKLLVFCHCLRDLVLILYIFMIENFHIQSYNRNWKSKNNLSINKLLDYWFFIHYWPYWHDHDARDFSTEVLNESSPNLDCDLVITLLNNELPSQWRVRWFDIKWYIDANEKYTIMDHAMDYSLNLLNFISIDIAQAQLQKRSKGIIQGSYQRRWYVICHTSQKKRTHLYFYVI